MALEEIKLSSWELSGYLSPYDAEEGVVVNFPKTNLVCLVDSGDGLSRLISPNVRVSCTAGFRPTRVRTMGVVESRPLREGDTTGFSRLLKDALFS